MHYATRMKKTRSHWHIFFLIASLEGGYALFALLRIPTDPANNLILGLSVSRLLMAVALLGIAFLAA